MRYFSGAHGRVDRVWFLYRASKPQPCCNAGLGAGAPQLYAPRRKTVSKAFTGQRWEAASPTGRSNQRPSVKPSSRWISHHHWIPWSQARMVDQCVKVLELSRVKLGKFIGQEGKPLSSLPAPTPTDPALDALHSATQALSCLAPRTVLHVPTVDVVLVKARQSGAQTPSESESDAGAAHPLLCGQIGQTTQSPQVPGHTFVWLLAGDEPEASDPGCCQTSNLQDAGP